MAAEATTTLRVGSLVFGNDYRHPVVLAKEIATLDLFSEGRVEFGLGAGWMTTRLRAVGHPDRCARRPHRPHGREPRRHEVAVVDGRGHLRGRALPGDRGDRSCPSPVQRPHPPIIIGGGGQRVLGFAAREADIVGVNPSLAAGYVGPEVLETTRLPSTTTSG